MLLLGGTWRELTRHMEYIQTAHKKAQAWALIPNLLGDKMHFYKWVIPELEDIVRPTHHILDNSQKKITKHAASE